MTELNGIINIYKQKGCTSHDVVMKVRKALKTKKVGHAGTLDPDAEGVLTVCVGKGTKLVELMTEKDKEYVATVKLGVITDTQDITGQVIESRVVGDIMDDEIKEVLNKFMGDYMQVPPMYSAIKVGGKKLYEIAREGRVIEREARKVSINNIEFIERISKDEFLIKVDCSKGTYIRTLCHDIGEKIGVGACMKTLIRTRVANYTLNECLKLEDLDNQELIEQRLISVENSLDRYEKLQVNGIGEKQLINGAKISLKNIKNSDIIIENKIYRVYNVKEEFIALYKSIYEDGSLILKIEKMFS